MKRLFQICLFACFATCFCYRSNAQLGTTTIIAGSAYSPLVYNTVPVPASGPCFFLPEQFCKDKFGNYYVHNLASHTIRKVDALTNMVTTFAGNGTEGYSGDGGPAILASISDRITQMATDTSGNLIFADQNRLRKVNVSTGAISTLVSLMYTDRYFGSVYIDRSNNVFYCENEYGHIHKIDATTGTGTILPVTQYPIAFTVDSLGNIYYASSDKQIIKRSPSGTETIVAGHIDWSYYYYGDGMPATQAVFGGIYSLQVANNGDIYVSDGAGPTGGSSSVVVRKINATTGIINKVAFGLPQLSSSGWDPGSEPAFPGRGDNIKRDNSGGYLYTGGDALYYLDHDYTAINRIFLTDTVLSPASTLPTVSFGISGTIHGRPSAGEQITLKMNFGDDSVITFHMPYEPVVDAVTGDTTYHFGTPDNWIGAHHYKMPGVYRPYIIVTSLFGYRDFISYPPVRAATTDTTNLRDVLITNIDDSIITAPCVFPAIVSRTIRGKVGGTSLRDQDSVYLRINNDDSTVDIFAFRPQAGGHLETYFGIDSVYNFAYTYTHPYSARYADPLNPLEPGYGYKCLVYATINGGVEVAHDEESKTGGNLYTGEMFQCQEPCNTTHIPPCDPTVGINLMVDDSVTACHNTVPYWGNVHLNGSVFGITSSSTSFPIHVDFGDGTDTTIVVTDIHSESGIFMYSVPVFYHLYTTAGEYEINAWADTSMGTTVSYPYTISLSESCASVSGSFYKDNNHNCSYDWGETKLAYWPFIVINNITGDTTNYWTDNNGNYQLDLHSTDSFTIIGNHTSYFGSGGSGDSLIVTCPATGMASVSAGAGGSFTQNFGFNCAGVSGSVDMQVAAWGWGFVPGMSGVLSIWSGDAWGYMCGTLSSTVTLTLDSNLIYDGMWSGPEPTTITGNILTWDFSTEAELFDFTANVRFYCPETLMMGDSLRNSVHIAATTLPDPDLSNNTYSWVEPVRTSWDPNEKEVSPKGYGTEGYIENGTPLNFIVHFQNTGTADAINIKIIDTLDENLDLSTLQILNSSSPVTLVQKAQNVIEFKFSDVFLPPDSYDFAGSNGFVAFNILPKDNLPAGTQIQNTANIYFDYNPAVVTNTTLNTIEDSVRMITGASQVCVEGAITLSNALAGGIWSATNGNATVSATGVVLGVHPGTDTIVYTMYGDKNVYKVITVLGVPDPGVITGSNLVCVAGITTLSSTVAGGSWSSTGNATVTGGIVTGVATGSAIISYTVTNSCGTASDTMLMTVNTIPVAASLTGSSTLCAAATTTLTADIAGGTWSSSSSAATVAAGAVTGVSGGATTISYSVTNNCGTTTATKAMTINALPDAGTITGTAYVCPGAHTTLSNVITGGTWSSSTSAATVASGVVTGTTAGSSVISYSVTNGCGTAVDTMLVTVNPLPDAGIITGMPSVCPASVTTLSNATTGGTWSSSSSVATVTGGIVTGASAGTAIISYSVTNICGTATDTMLFTVNPLPDAGTITGVNHVCPSATTTLSNYVAGGTWNSSSSVATVTGGIVTGASAGATIISYSVTNTCGTATDTMMITVNPLPDAGIITGTPSVCQAAVTTLTNTTTGGTWSSSSPAVTVAGGLVTGATAGTAIISYSVTNICGTATDTMLFTVNPLPDAGTITGINNVCPSAATTLTNTVAGGTWSSSSSAATVTGGIVSGASAGTTIISYSVTNMCGTATDTMLLTVNPLPDAGTITGTPSVCPTATITLSNVITVGTWSSSSTSATVAGGLVTGVTAGTAIISYSVTNVCGTATDTLLLTVNPSPDAGSVSTTTAHLCVGAVEVIDITVPGGSWTSSNPAVGLTDTGVIANSPGSSLISYSVTDVCGTATDTMTITVDALPDAGSLSGSATVCVGATISLTTSVTGGTWSATSSLLTITSAGDITGVATGTDTVLYTVSGTCGTDTAIQVITVATAPVAASISGADSICEGATLSLAASTIGGTWGSSDAGILSVTTGGVITANAPGPVTISYALTNTCGTTTTTHSVYVIPAADCNNGIAGTGNISQPITIYPNPSSGTFTVQIPGAVNNATITVTDVSGKVLQVLHPQPGQHLTQVSLTNLASGTYMVKVEADGLQYRDKLVLW